MDQESRKLFAHPVVTVGGYRDNEGAIQSACRAIFGRVLSPEDFVEFIGAPDGSSLEIEANIGEEYNDVALRLNHYWFGEPHQYVVFLDEETGKRIVYIESVVHKNEAPDYLATRILGRQVQTFRQYGINEIRLYADGHSADPSGICGYYVWARLGYAMYLHGFGNDLIAAGLEPVDNTLELFAQNGGSEWWREHGSAREAYFYLGEGSPCIRALQLYLAEKGVDLDE